MNPPSTAVARLISVAQSGVIDFQLLQELTRDHELDHASLVNQLADYVARAYAYSEMDFDTADVIMNAAFSVCTSEAFLAANDRELLEPMFTIYRAFDEGEYFHPGDLAHEVPEIKYTRPLIEANLRAVAHDV
jgi:hypothetical protein